MRRPGGRLAGPPRRRNDHVDDLLADSDDKTWKALTSEMKQAFRFTDLGQLKEFLGMSLTRGSGSSKYTCTFHLF